jgi:hypothetical protein
MPFFAHANGAFYCSNYAPYDDRHDKKDGRFTLNHMNAHIITFDTLKELLEASKTLSPLSVVIERCNGDPFDSVLEGKAVTYLMGTKEGLCSTPIAMIEYNLPPVLFVKKLGYNKYEVTNINEGVPVNE